MTIKVLCFTFYFFVFYHSLTFKKIYILSLQKITFFSSYNNINLLYFSDEQKNLLLEVLTLYIVLLSTRLHFVVGDSYPQLFRDEIFIRNENENIHSFPIYNFTQKLLEFFINDELRKYKQSQGLFSTILSYSWAAYEKVFQDELNEDYHNISDLSLYLLLILVSDTRQNPFLNALSGCYDIHFLLHSSDENNDNENNHSSIQISYSNLYDTISNLLSIHGRTSSLLLLLHLLQTNSLFLSYVLSRSDLEVMVSLFFPEIIFIWDVEILFFLLCKMLIYILSLNNLKNLEVSTNFEIQIEKLQMVEKE